MTKAIRFCDRCGEAGEDVQTYLLRQDGKAWQADLDDRHANEVTVTQFMKIGTEIEATIHSATDFSHLESRIRGFSLPET